MIKIDSAGYILLFSEEQLFALIIIFGSTHLYLETICALCMHSLFLWRFWTTSTALKQNGFTQFLVESERGTSQRIYSTHFPGGCNTLPCKTRPNKNYFYQVVYTV